MYIPLLNTTVQSLVSRSQDFTRGVEAGVAQSMKILKRSFVSNSAKEELEFSNEVIEQ